MRVVRTLFAVAVVLGAGRAASSQQIVDPDFDPRVDRPAYTDRHPRVLFDEAHNNYHTAGGRYKPFATLITNDGYVVTPGTKALTKESLQGYDILIVVNPQLIPPTKPAFTDSECDAVRAWVEAGGALLLLAKQHPWGPASEPLARRLGVEMGLSGVVDKANSEQSRMASLVFSRENGLIGDHPILVGRDDSERIHKVHTYSGQSLVGPNSAVTLLKLGDTAEDRPPAGSKGRSGSAAGRVMGLAMTLGKGRAVIIGEAGLLSAQLFGPNRAFMGMNVPGVDNRQFGLNIMHWLSGLKDLGAGAGAGAGGVARKAEAAKPKVAARTPAAAPTAPSAPPPADPGRPLSTAEIAAQSEASIALIAAEDGSGTGFLIGPGLLMTNSHVISDEFMPQVKVRFPSAEKDQQGPFSTDLVYEDARRDLAILTVKSPLAPLRISPRYSFRKGDDIVVIGNPGAGGKLILENAISRGIMSTRTTLSDYPYYQLGISVNPGNSGGPVFDSTGAVIGVLSRKSSNQEGLAYCIPVEDLHAAIKKASGMTPAAIDVVRSKHRMVAAVDGLGTAGALYSLAITFRRRPQLGPQGKPVAKTKRALQFYTSTIATVEKKVLPTLRSEAARVHDDPLVTKALRDKVTALGENVDKYKALYDKNSGTAPPSDPFPDLKATHRRLLNELCDTLAMDRPEYMFVFNLVPAGSNSGDTSRELEKAEAAAAK